MTPFQRHRWFVAAAGITLVFALMSFIAHRGYALAALADFVGLGLMLAAAALSFTNAIHCPRQERSFWALLAFGFALWVANQAAWTYWETVLRHTVPDPFFFDIVLFFHTVPMIAAVAWRPDVVKKQWSVRLSALNFLTLLGWWVFLYAFIVFPYQYVSSNFDKYNTYYDRLYGMENVLLLAVLGLAARTASGDWRRFYLHLFAATTVYAVNSQLLDRAMANNTYYSGGPYDIALIATVSWMAAAVLSARKWDLASVEFNLDPRWKRILPQLAMLAILSLPMLGLWTIMADTSNSPVRMFRIFAVLAAMIFLGTFVFMRQYFQDQALVVLLHESRHGYETQKQLQGQLVQKEKLATLGNLVAGAAREIEYPLTAIVANSEQLWSGKHLTDDQNALLRKIVNQTQRTRDLIANLLSFAQQTPGEKALVDLTMLLQRTMQMLEPRYPGGKIQVAVDVAANLPRVQGNVNQLFQVFIEIAENAMDAMLDGGGGSLKISAEGQSAEAVIQFSDSGPGIREPQRVFDPFYTTKPVGKGAGLGLSVAYGIVQDHGGHITCENKDGGGALFVVRLPTAVAEPAAQVAGAASA
jgi:signal transduction histidine kinase